MKKILVIAAAVAAVFYVMGCSSMSIEDFKDTKPQFVLEDYFAGKSRAWGMVLNRSGKPIRFMTVDLEGKWDGNELTLDEFFTYSDGETQRRQWKVIKKGPDNYEGRAADVIGVARGVHAGSALNWSYVLRLKVKDSEYDIRFDDWMFLQPDGVLINRAVMKKWGFKVGEIVLFFRKM